MAPLGDLATFEMGQAPPGAASNFSGDGEIFVKAGEFGERHPVVREWTTKPLKYATDKDVLICVVGATAGKLNLGIDCAIGRSVAAIRPSATLNQLALYFQLLISVLSLRASSTGSAQGVISKKMLAEIPIALPPLNEQRRIATKLDTTLAAVEACRQRLDGVAAIFRRFRQAVLAAATTGEMTREWREERGKSVEPWKMVKTKEAGNIQLSRQRSPKYHSGPTMRPYLRVQNVFEDRIDLDDVMEMDFSGADLVKFTLHPGDILLNEGQSPQYLGRPAMYRGELPGACFTNSLIRFQAGASVAPEFALLVFRHYMHSGRYVSEGTITTNIAHLSAGRFGEVEFPLPSPGEQAEIVRRTQELFTLADQLEARLTATRKIVDRLTPALLAKAFRGELVPQDPNDEPASMLLERTRAARQAEAASGKPSRRGRRKAAASPEQAPPTAAPAPADLLAQLLQECGALSERALLAASELDPAGFRAQLALEQGMGAIRETAQDGQVLLEAVG
jgi:type I restriction enzyme S subunit